MQLIEIDKARYRKNLNVVIIGFIASLLILSLLFGSILINLFSSIPEVTEFSQSASDVVTDVVNDGVSNQEGIEQESNFRYNLLGVILALLANAAVLHSVKDSKYFKEIIYVWRLKQSQNLIYRKFKKIKLAADNGEDKALTILSFYYESQIQVYQLDDNTITLSTVQSKLAAIKEQANKLGLTINSSDFDKSLLKDY